MKSRSSHRHFLSLITGTAIVLFCGGVFFYYYFFRQINAQLIETIPCDAAFLFQINDNDTFIKTVKNIRNNLNPLFGLDAYSGCQFFVDQLPGKYNQVVFSGHPGAETFSILFACKINERAFKQLLTKLQIDTKNCSKFEQCKIYTYGTHLKRFVFTYDKGIFLASENVTLLKRSIVQLRNPRNLTTLKSFVALFQITEKNKKQNWLILNHEKYFSNFEPYIQEETNSILGRFATHVTWSAYQVRFSDLEMRMSGYLSINDNFDDYFNAFEQKYLYYSSLSKNNEPVNYENDAVLKYAKSILPTYSDYELLIHAENPEYWSRYLSETGMKKFAFTQTKLFAFTIDSLNTKFKTANAILRF
jgi:hypothetical protein